MYFGAQGPSVDLGLPDVCKTPVAPFPHVDIGLGLMGNLNVTHILWGGMPAHNKKTKILMTFGDNAGIGLGVRKARVMAYSERKTGSGTFLVKGVPAVRVMSLTKQNGGNCPGLLSTPPQLTCVNCCA